VVPIASHYVGLHGVAQTGLPHYVGLHGMAQTGLPHYVGLHGVAQTGLPHYVGLHCLGGFTAALHGAGPIPPEPQNRLR